MKNTIDIIGFEGLYKISPDGKVYSIFKSGYPKLIRYWINRNGYPYYTLSSHTKKGISIHRLQAIHFIPNPEGKPHINHKDGNKMNYALENLEWCTASENHIHRYRELGQVTWLKGRSGSLHNRSKQVAQFAKNGDFIKIYGSVSDAAKSINIKPSNISRCASGGRPSAGGFLWKIGKDLHDLNGLEKSITQ